jgi:hypothetical protein
MTPGSVAAYAAEGKHTDSATRKSVVHMLGIHRTDTAAIGEPDTRHIDDGFPIPSDLPLAFRA